MGAGGKKPCLSVVLGVGLGVLSLQGLRLAGRMGSSPSDRCSRRFPSPGPSVWAKLKLPSGFAEKLECSPGNSGGVRQGWGTLSCRHHPKRGQAQPGHLQEGPSPDSQGSCVALISSRRVWCKGEKLSWFTLVTLLSPSSREPSAQGQSRWIKEVLIDV